MGTLPLPARVYQGLRRFLPHDCLMPVVTAYQKASNWVRFGDPTFPRSIGIEVTTHCNRACAYCPQSVERLPPRHIDVDLYHRILERVREIRWGGPLDFHFYNEPLLEERLEGLVRLARAVCQRALPRIFTNGDRLTEARLRSLVAAGVVNINVTRHPPFDDGWDARIASLTRRYPQWVQSRCIDDASLSNRAGLVSPRRVQSLAAGCHMPSYSLHIDIDGRYLFCCCDYRRVHVLGDVREHGIVEAWAHAGYRLARLQANAGHPALDICHACFGTNRNGSLDGSLAASSEDAGPLPVALGAQHAVPDRLSRCANGDVEVKLPHVSSAPSDVGGPAGLLAPVRALAAQPPGTLDPC